jgi:hypothetical protein
VDDSDSLARAVGLREQMLASVREENERMAREAARNRCDQCPHPKPARDEVVTLPNGIRLSVYVAHCRHPGPDCTARVQSHLLSEPPEVANRMVEHLAAEPGLAAAGVGWLACLAPDAERLILTYRVPESARVAAAVGSLSVEAFRDPRPDEPGAAPDGREREG